MKPRFDHALQLKIALKGVQPPIWRRIEVPCTFTSRELHIAIKSAMGWQDCHLQRLELPLHHIGRFEAAAVRFQDAHWYVDDAFPLQ